MAETNLKKLLEEARKATQDLRETFEGAMREGETLQDFVLGALRDQATFIEVNLKANSDLFSTTVKEAERDLRIELDRLYRQQLDMVRKLQQIGK